MRSQTVQRQLRRHRPFTLEAVVRRLHQILPPFNQRRLTWDEAIGLANRLGVPVVLQRSRVDAYLSKGLGGHRIIVDGRIDHEDWGTFAVMHELYTVMAATAEHRTLYPGTASWLANTETPANMTALLALFPQPAGPPYPRILSAASDGQMIALQMAVMSRPRTTDQLTQRWISKNVTLQRHR